MEDAVDLSRKEVILSGPGDMSWEEWKLLDRQFRVCTKDLQDNQESWCQVRGGRRYLASEE